MDRVIDVLVSLYPGYGMGDAVQMSAVLRHVRKYRPHWRVHFQADRGRECVGRGIAHSVFCYGEPDPVPVERYDAEVQILLYDTFANWPDRPNTRVSSCLHERFGIAWDSECGRYQINISERVSREVGSIVPRRSVAVHYQGVTARQHKDLTDYQASAICACIYKLGRQPILIDWSNQSSLRDNPIIRSTGSPPFNREWGASAEYNASVISRCEAFVGIDSGPGKCASATDTPSLIVWTGHHPSIFHDPADNTTHLIPRDYPPDHVCYIHHVADFFEKNYNVRTYCRRDDSQSLIEGVQRWLTKTLR